MEKIWLKNYPNGIPEFIPDSEFQPLDVLIHGFCKTFSERPALTCMGKTISYKELDQHSQHIATFLRKVLHLKPGDRVAIMLPNILQNPIFTFGCLRAGITVVNVNPLYTARELEHQLVDSSPRAIVILENFAHVLESVVHKTKIERVILTSMGELLGGLKGPLVDFVVRHIKKMVPAFRLEKTILFTQALKMGSEFPFKPVEIKRSDIAFLQYTGGTTGVSKGAMLSNGNLWANVQQALSFIRNFDVLSEREIVITPLPLYHIFALVANGLVFSAVGAQSILIPNPKDLKSFVKELKKYRFTAITGVNTLFNALAHRSDFAGVDCSALRLSVAGGMAMQKAVADKWQEITRCVIVQGYGLTETSPVATFNPLNVKNFNGTVGMPVPSTLISIRDDSFKEVPLGQVGEVCIQGPQVMQGYWKRPEETAQVIKDGWLLSGDLGFMDQEGFLTLVDRKKDIIIVSGFNVYPNEIEDVLIHHPGIFEAAAIGVPDERTGEAIQIFIVKKDPNLSKDDILHYCRENLTGYKIPKHIEFRNDLPKSNVGKVLRKELRPKTSSK